MAFQQTLCWTCHALLVECLRGGHIECLNYLCLVYRDDDDEALWNIVELGWDRCIPDFMEMMCQLPVVRYLAEETHFDLNDEIEYVHGESENEVHQTREALLNFALTEQRWDVVQYMIQLNDPLLRTAVEYAIDKDDVDLEDFLVNHYGIDVKLMK
jgi:hypothetical protein